MIAANEHLAEFCALEGRSILSRTFIVRRSPKLNVSRPPQEVSVYVPARDLWLKVVKLPKLNTKAKKIQALDEKTP